MVAAAAVAWMAGAVIGAALEVVIGRVVERSTFKSIEQQIKLLLPPKFTEYLLWYLPRERREEIKWATWKRSST